MRIMRTWIGKKYTGKMSCASDKIYDLMFGTYGKKFKGRPANYWLLTDNEKRKEYTGDSLVRQEVSPAFFLRVFQRHGMCQPKPKKSE